MIQASSPKKIESGLTFTISVLKKKLSHLINFVLQDETFVGIHSHTNNSEMVEAQKLKLLKRVFTPEQNVGENYSIEVI